jgi:eukaryotic-like serine/threonine-protein kinase
MTDVDHERKSIPRIGAVLAGKYEVERVLGAGAMGVVVAAQHRLLRQTVALKLISGSRETRTTAVARFTREARAIAGLASDHIVRILDFGLLDEGTPFMVMQYLPGRDLASEVRARGGKLPQVEAVDHVIHACAGLAIAHGAGIVHRDIKPGNLLLTTRANGEPLVVIVDFGISKTLQSEEELSLTLSQTTLGSPLYMSPEQIRDSKTVDARTDIWSLGVVLRFLLTGKHAFTAGDASGVLAAVIADEPAPMRADVPEIDPGLESVVSRCLEKKAAFRYGSAAALAEALAPYASEAGGALARGIPGVRIGSALTEARRTEGMEATGAVLRAHDVGTFASMTGTPRRSLRSTGRLPAVIGTAAALACAAAIGITVLRAHPAVEEPAALMREPGPAGLSLSPPASHAALRTSLEPEALPSPSSAPPVPTDAGRPALAASLRRVHAPPVVSASRRLSPAPPASVSVAEAPAPGRAIDAPSDPLDTAK